MKREVTWAMAMRPKPCRAKDRILKELKKMQRDPPTGFSAAPRGDDLYHWDAVVFGLYESAWSGGTFKLSLDFTVDYPYKPPEVRFLCPMFHPNVYADGRICCDILQRLHWTPVYDVESILIRIQCLLCNPNRDCFPENSVAAKLYLEDQREYNRRVTRVVEQSWTSD